MRLQVISSPDIRSTMLRFSKISALGAVFHVLSHICARVLFFLLEGFACKNIRKRVCVNARVKPAAFLNALARARLCVFLIESPPGKLTGPRVAQPQISRIYISAGRLLEFSISALHVKGACVHKKKNVR